MIAHSAPWITAADRQAVERRLAEGQIASGALAASFEDEVKAHVGAAHARSAPDGTSAIAAALRGLGIGSGDDVVLPTYVCVDVELAVRAVGAAPRFADVDRTGTITAETAAAAITPRTRAIIAVHSLGRPCAIGPLRALNVPVIEDACQAFGFAFPEGTAGTLGDIGIYSFHATKCLTTGEGGMIVCAAGDLLPEPAGEELALCPRLSDLQAALGLAQLSRYDSMLGRRAEIRRTYDAALGGRGGGSRGPAGGALFRYTFELRDSAPFEAATRHFADRGIHLRRGVDALLHRRHGLPDDRFPGACALFARNASVPFYPALTDHEVGLIARALAEYDGVA
ncbi:MAG: DegT/DnrJ/EryC1/StrS family aminotransferase [Cypionkella sp.]